MTDLGINDELKNILTRMEYKGGQQIKFSELKKKQSVMGSLAINSDPTTGRFDMVRNFQVGSTVELQPLALKFQVLMDSRLEKVTDRTKQYDLQLFHTVLYRVYRLGSHFYHMELTVFWSCHQKRQSSLRRRSRIGNRV